MHMRVEVARTFKRIVKMKVENGILYVVANFFLSDKKLKAIIDQNIDWINSQKAVTAPSEQNAVKAPCREEKLISDNHQLQEPTGVPTNRLLKDIYDGRKTVVMGEVVRVVSGVGAKSYLDGETLYISEKYYGNRESRLKAVKLFLKKLSVTYVSEEIANFGCNVSLCPAKIEFKDNDDFWVKCSLAGQRILCFDFRIAQLPPHLRKYVIAHGFAHFAYPLHDDRFWNFVAESLPKYREYAKELEQYRVLKDI